MAIEALRVFTSKQPPKAEAATEALIAELHRVIDDLRQDRDEWRAQAQRLGELAIARPAAQLALPAPESAQPEQPVVPEQPIARSHWRRAWNSSASRRIAEADCAWPGRRLGIRLNLYSHVLPGNAGGRGVAR